jgi:glutamate decarboxylase
MSECLLPERGMDPEDAYERIRDELHLDDPAGTNLGSFVQPRMDPWAEKLVVENLGKNLVCSGEYRQSKAIHDRMVAALAELFHAPERARSRATGTATGGSSEAIQLGLLAHRFAWKKRRAAAGLSTDRPNLVFFADSHVCWDKFCRFFDVEPRKVPIERRGAGYGYSLERLAAHIDENTICVGAVAGTTYTGACHPVAAIQDLLDGIAEAHGWDIPIHVDAATGGFLLPFLGERTPDEAWDFRLPRVRSINVSGHKFGLVHPGLGWLLFRDAESLPRELVFGASYLGGSIDTFTLSFSRSAAPILAQYYAFVRHGREGYRAIARRCGALARALAARIDAGGACRVASDLVLPVVCFRPEGVDALELSRRLRARGFVVPAYAMPEGGEGEGDVVLRVVVHERFDLGLVTRLADAIDAVCAELQTVALAS